jgi:Zn-finger nucleic acid-binding protein
MNSKDFLTPAELNALLTAEEREQLQAEFVPDHTSTGAAHIGFEQVPEVIAVGLDPNTLEQLLETVSSLTLRVEALEYQLQQRTVKMEHAAAITPSAPADTPSIPAPGSFSRSESYGRNHKKKRSLIQKLLD